MILDIPGSSQDNPSATSSPGPVACQTFAYFPPLQLPSNVGYRPHVSLIPTLPWPALIA